MFSPTSSLGEVRLINNHLHQHDHWMGMVDVVHLVHNNHVDHMDHTLSSQEMQGEEVTAGLCYMIICFPSVFMLLIPTLAGRLLK